MNTVILGAGLIGLYVGGRILENSISNSIYFIGSKNNKNIIIKNNLKLNSYKKEKKVLKKNINYFLPEEFTQLNLKIDLLIICLKSNKSQEGISQIMQSICKETLVLTLQNGVMNKQIIQKILPYNHIFEGLIMFNVILNKEQEFYQSTSGDIILDSKIKPFVENIFNKSSLSIIYTNNIDGYLFSKLLININNPINALAGIPIKAEMENRGYRKILSNAMSELLNYVKLKNIKLEKLTPVNPYFIPFILKLPNFVYKVLTKKSLDIDPLAKSSMLMDLENKKITEIDELFGDLIIIMNKEKLNSRVLKILYDKIINFQFQKNGSPKLSPEEIICE